MLDRFFGLTENGTDFRRELLAGLTTFLTMAYIVVVNPSILSDAGMDWGAVFVATCLAAALGSLIMGLYANYPFGLAPGMGLNAYFAYGVVLGMGIAWQTALGAVFVSGILFLIISLLPIREWIINAIPMSLKMAISAGIGLPCHYCAEKRWHCGGQSSNAGHSRRPHRPANTARRPRLCHHGCVELPQSPGCGANRHPGRQHYRHPIWCRAV